MGRTVRDWPEGSLQAVVSSFMRVLNTNGSYHYFYLIVNLDCSLGENRTTTEPPVQTVGTGPRLKMIIYFIFPFFFFFYLKREGIVQSKYFWHRPLWIAVMLCLYTEKKMEKCWGKFTVSLKQTLWTKSFQLLINNSRSSFYGYLKFVSVIQKQLQLSFLWEHIDRLIWSKETEWLWNSCFLVW